MICWYSVQDTYRRRQMQRTITRQMSFDLTKLLVSEDWFSDISPQTMRRLLNIVSITGKKWTVGTVATGSQSYQAGNLSSIYVHRASFEGQSYHFQLGPAGLLDPLDRRVAIQDLMDHPVSGRDWWSVWPGHSQDPLWEVHTGPLMLSLTISSAASSNQSSQLLVPSFCIK